MRYRIPVVSCKYLSHKTFHDKSKGLKHTIHEGASRFPFTPLWEDRESQVRRRRLRPTAVSHFVFTSVSLAEGKAAARRGSTRSRQLEKQKLSATCSTRCLTHPFSHCFGMRFKQIVVINKKIIQRLLG